MSAGATITPAVEISTDRRSAGRMVVVGGAYLAIVIVAAVYPLVSPLSAYWGEITQLDQAVGLLGAVLWLAIMLVRPASPRADSGSSSSC